MASVIVQIVTFNSANCIEECLNSVFSQTFEDIKVVVLDNDSSDGTVDLILTKFSDKNFEIIRSETNLGFSRGHNIMITRYPSQYKFVLNPDATLEPSYIEKIYRFLEKEADTGMATGTIYRDKMKRIIDSTGIRMTKLRRAFDLRQGKELTTIPDRVEKIFGVCAAVGFYRSSMLEDCSIQGEYFDEDFFAYKEDVDLAWRANLLGWKAAYIPWATAYHSRGWEYHKIRSTISKQVRIHSFKNRYLMLIKNENLRQPYSNKFLMLLYETLRFSYVLIREPFLLSAYRDVWNLAPKMVMKRRVLREKINRSIID